MNHSSFIEAIRENPDDDMIRLVYADFLEECGETERSELIRLQIELKQGVRDRGRQVNLLARIRSVLLTHRTSWLGILQECCPDAVFERGFIQSLTLPASTFAIHIQPILAQHPISTVRLVLHTYEDVFALLHCSLLEAIPRIDIRGNKISTEWLRTLLEGKDLGKIQVIEFTNCSFDHVVFSRFLRHPSLHGLRQLIFPGNNLGPDINWFLHSLQIPYLERLDLSLNNISDHGARTLAEATSLGNLQYLRLRDNQLTEDAVVRIATSPLLSKLTILDVTNNPIDRAAARMLNTSFTGKILC